jgi:23S rRNA G2069 N7-methylase RlmK/C1962 C5-methylase RlmI
MEKQYIEPPILIDGEDKTSAFKNCIRKNYKHIRKWAKRTQTNSFRIYDREMHHYPLAIDYYAGRYCVHFFSKKYEDDYPSVEFEVEVEETLIDLFGCERESIFWRTRIRREKYQQYEKANTSKDFFVVYEYGVKFKVNLLDYLDTGLFLDHRETRQLVSKDIQGKSLLNLFAYTASFSVHAAVKGASFTKTVDMSNTYTQWGIDNFALNDLDLKKNEVVRDDCLKFLETEIQSGLKYDVIVIDPPTISRSKKMDQMFDVQLDYIYLIQSALKLLTPEGKVYFSTNSRRFDFDESEFLNCSIREISNKTLPLDFHDPKIHRCWIISNH